MDRGSAQHVGALASHRANGSHRLVSSLERATGLRVVHPSPRPVSLEAEQALLGAILLDGRALARVSVILRPEHFGLDEHRRIYVAMLDCGEDQGAIDLLTVSERLARNSADGNGMSVYLGTMAQNTPSAAHVVRYAELVIAEAKRRQLAALGTEIAERAAAPGTDPDELRRTAESRLSALEARDVGPKPLDLAELATREPCRPQFIIEDWLPCGYASLLAGHGGAGKSAIALHFAVCIALGHPYFGLQVGRRRVLYLSCEDRADVLHWRLSRIATREGINLSSLSERLDVLDLVGRDTVLWERDPRTGFSTTPAYGRLHESMRRYRAEVLIVDGVADTFGGNENARGEVKRYINSLAALIPLTGAVLLVAHVAKPTASGTSTSEGYSGSTSWHNSVRARWYLSAEVAKGDEDERPERTGRLMLELQKSNLGRAEGSLAFRWDEDAHMFLAEQNTPSVFDRKVQEREERAGILRAFQACAEFAPVIVVPAALQGPRTALHVLQARPEFPDSLRSGKLGARRFRRILEDLRQSRAIEEVEYRRKNRHNATHLVITTEGLRECVT